MIDYSPKLPDAEGQSWGRAAHAFSKIVNDQLSKSNYNLYAINSGFRLVFPGSKLMDKARRKVDLRGKRPSGAKPRSFRKD
jgi:hypothetical protein